MSKKVKILMGSDSDWQAMRAAFDTVKEFGIEADAEVASAHRTPERVIEICQQLERDGFGVVICGAGHAAHLAGVVASKTTLPVIGVPLDSSALQGLDALLSTVQMPPGIPVATVAIGKPGAKNAAILAVEMLAISDPALQEKLKNYRSDMAEKVKEKNKKLDRN